MAQEPVWLKQTKISEVIAFEKRVNPSVKFLSENVSLSKEYYPLNEKYHTTKPLIVQRKPLKYLTLNAEYFFTPGDSVLRLVSYDWEEERYSNLFDKQRMWKEEGKKMDVYNKEYERIKEMLLSQLGKPTADDNSPKEVTSDGSKYLNRDTFWEDENLYANLNLIFASSTYRIRLTVYWKK